MPGNECAMSGNAMFTIVASMKAIAPPSDAIASTVRGEGFRRTRRSRPATRSSAFGPAWPRPAGGAGQGAPLSVLTQVGQAGLGQRGS